MFEGVCLLVPAIVLLHRATVWGPELAGQGKPHLHLLVVVKNERVHLLALALIDGVQVGRHQPKENKPRRDAY